jgi:zinc transporter 7
MGTLYISGPPNFLLALCPPNIDPSSLNIMVAFAVGGLLGDTFFHLLPEIFLGEVPEGEVKAVLVEPNKNLLLGVAIMIGFVTFVAMDKGLRIATGGGDGHSHSHDHGASNKTPVIASTTAVDIDDKTSIRNRKDGAKPTTPAKTSAVTDPKPSIKLSAYLNIIADFTHNITDGLAMSSSFYASPTLGATTTLAVFCHEIPHEVGDFALLIQGGMSKRTAMGLQFVTALGAVLGTFIGIAVQELGGNAAAAAAAAASGASGTVGNQGLWGTSLLWGDLLLPFTAGTFLYVGTVGVIPEMLETGPNRWAELRSMALQFAAMAAGAGIMLT